jgi:hypothetical protein
MGFLLGGLVGPADGRPSGGVGGSYVTHGRAEGERAGYHDGRLLRGPLRLGFCGKSFSSLRSLVQFHTETDEKLIPSE